MVHTKFFKTVLLFGAVVAFLAAATAPASAQGTGTIRGVVTESGSGQPILGVQIHVLGTRLTGITDENGAYQIPNVPVGTVDLRVRMIGYSRASANATLTANLPLELNFEMRQSVIALEAVVVTGAGAAVEKKQLGNTIATVDMSRIQDAPVQTFSEALAGREPSVSVGASGGLAGAGARIRIRGSSSLSMSNEPVVYVDGVRVDNGGGSTNVGTGAAGASRLDDISPESIERIEVLKGAAAATLYGSEASNGVIQIFTKKGSRGAPRFSFRIEQGISRFPSGAQKVNAGFARDQAQADDINEVYQHTPGWTDVVPFEVFERDFANDISGTGRQQTYSVSVTGGGESVNYFASGRFNHDNGPMANVYGPARDVSRSIQGTASVTVFPRERLSFRIGTLYTDRMNAFPTNGNSIYGVYARTQAAKPEEAYCDDLDGDGRMDVTTEVIGNTTPVCANTGNTHGNLAFMTTRETMQTERQQDAEHFNGSVTASYQAADRLNFEATFGLDVTNSQNFFYRAFASNVDNFTGNSNYGSRSIGQRNHREVTLDVKGIWDERFGNFTSQFTAGFQGFISTNKESGGDGSVFPGPGLEIVDAAANTSVFERWLQVVNTGAFMQEQIGFNDYAYFTVGGRWDKNSAFGENTGGAFYPKASISLVFSDMPGWSGSLLSTLRIRGAVGKSGLQPGAFDKFQTYQSGTTTLGAGLRPANLGNEDLAPEKSTEFEVGAEFGFFNDIMGIEATYWDRTTTDGLVEMQFPVSGGFNNLQLVNIGETRGRGLELKFDWLTMESENLAITTFATASYLKEQIVSMGTAPPIKVGGSYPRYRNFLMPPWDTNDDGEPDRYFSPGAYFGGALVDYTPGSSVPFDSDGDGEADSEATFRAWLASDAGDGAGVHSLGDSELSPLLRNDDGDADMLDTYLGKPSPDWSGSFGATITMWNRLDLNTLFEYKTGNFFVTNLTDAFRRSNSLIGRNTPKAAAAEAAIENPNATVDEKFDAAMVWATELKGLSPHSGLNTIEDAKFLAMREIGLTWRAPADIAGKLGLSNLAFNVTGRNLLKFTPYTGIDPESNMSARTVGSGADNNFNDSVDAFGTPLPRRFTLSVQFGF